MSIDFNIFFHLTGTLDLLCLTEIKDKILHDCLSKASDELLKYDSLDKILLGLPLTGADSRFPLRVIVIGDILYYSTLPITGTLKGNLKSL